MRVPGISLAYQSETSPGLFDYELTLSGGFTSGGQAPAVKEAAFVDGPLEHEAVAVLAVTAYNAGTQTATVTVASGLLYAATAYLMRDPNGRRLEVQTPAGPPTEYGPDDEVPLLVQGQPHGGAGWVGFSAVTLPAAVTIYAAPRRYPINLPLFIENTQLSFYIGADEHRLTGDVLRMAGVDNTRVWSAMAWRITIGGTPWAGTLADVTDGLWAFGVDLGEDMVMVFDRVALGGAGVTAVRQRPVSHVGIVDAAGQPHTPRDDGTLADADGGVSAGIGSKQAYPFVSAQRVGEFGDLLPGYTSP